MMTLRPCSVLQPAYAESRCLYNLYMKTLLRVLLVLFVLVCLVIVGGYLYVTNPGVQTRLVKQNLPEGSTVEKVHLSLGSIEVLGLDLLAEDGTHIQMARVVGDFSLLAALKDQTIKIDELTVSGMDVRLPEGAVSATSRVSGGASGERDESSTPAQDEAPDTVAEEAVEALNFDPLFELGELAWLFDVKRVMVDGSLTDGQGGRYVFNLDSTKVQPGAESTITLNLESAFAEARTNGLKTFKATAALQFFQKITGGFEKMRVDVDIAGQDSVGATLLALKKSVELAIDDRARTASSEVVLDIQLPKPELFMPELATLGAVELKSHTKVELANDVVTVAEADVNGWSNGREVIFMDLKKPVVLAGAPILDGELLELRLNELPADWVRPWLPGDIELDFEPITLDMTVSGDVDGGFQVRFAEPLIVNQLDFAQAGEALISTLDIAVHPELDIAADQSLSFAIRELKVADQYGPIIVGELSGARSGDADTAENPLAGVQSDLVLSLKLQPLLSQPMLKGKTSIMGGDLSLQARVNGDAEYPIELKVLLKDLRARSMPGRVQDYALRLNAKSPAAETWSAEVKLNSGSLVAPTTDILIDATVDTGSMPMEFEVALSGDQVRKTDFDVLTQALQPVESAPTVSQPSTPPVEQPGPQQPVDKPTLAVDDNRPPWADVVGTARVDIGRLVLSPELQIESVKADVIVSEALLQARELSAQLGEGQFNGTAEVVYSADADPAYVLDADLAVRQLNPQFFASGKPLPVHGQFDGKVIVAGSGMTLDDAAAQSDVGINIHGVDGVLTSFKLDDRMMAGISVLGGLLGQQQKNPGYAAVTEVLPYFKDITYSDLYFDVTRSSDGKISLDRLALLGDYLLFDGGGMIHASSWSDIMDSPMDMRLQLGSKGTLERPLEVLNLLLPEAAEDGYRRWVKEVKVPGTLNNPDTGSLMNLLLDAVGSAKSKPKASAAPGTTAGPSSATDATAPAGQKRNRAGSPPLIQQ